MRDFHVPVSIDDPKKAFIWDLDVFILFMSGFGIGIVSRHFFISMSISLFIAWRWGKLKSGKHQWFFCMFFTGTYPLMKKTNGYLKQINGSF
ncbi:TPA: type IV conjugative transfer system protein TraL [Neisseria meningitidis]|uniref:type IV conjugative transfer system protein TraL n=1 Tax=Neisseria meningitidis TaxID=487 RepID=UPI001EFE59E6|nr:type IV conjugative transfer system protein TraL [Neisseria meningitidis]